MMDNPTSGEANQVGVFRLIRNRVIAGLFVILPLYITFAVIRWLYDSAYTIAIGPIASGLRRAWGRQDVEPSWVMSAVSSLAAIGVVIAVLYVAGMFFRSRLHHAVDWTLRNVPGVNTVYSAVSNVFNALSNSQQTRDFKRVVLVKFPHSGMQAPAFVTSECKDISTGRKILCVYVPTTPLPTSGYMLLVPEEEVVPLNWNLEETLQAIVSGGITVPPAVSYDAPLSDSKKLPEL